LSGPAINKKAEHTKGSSFGSLVVLVLYDVLYNPLFCAPLHQDSGFVEKNIYQKKQNARYAQILTFERLRKVIRQTIF